MRVNLIFKPLFFLLMLSSMSTYCQTLMQDGLETPWISGVLTLENNTNLNGLIRYNVVNGLISFKESEDSREARSFKESKVVRMSLKNNETGKLRNFYSFPYKEDGQEKILLFEVLKEFKDWAVLSRRGKVVALEGKDDPVFNPYVVGVSKNNRAILAQEESIFAMNSEGTIEKFQTTTYFEKDGVFDTSRQGSIIDKSILEKYLGSYIKELEKFARTNNLKLKEKSDLLTILDHYETLVSSKD